MSEREPQLTSSSSLLPAPSGDCPTCHGSGHDGTRDAIHPFACPDCMGSGRVSTIGAKTLAIMMHHAERTDDDIAVLEIQADIDSRPQTERDFYRQEYRNLARMIYGPWKSVE